MNAQVIAILLGAAGVGLGGGYAVVDGWVPWELPVAMLIVACAVGVFMIRERVGRTVRASGRVVAASGRSVASSASRLRRRSQPL